MDPSSGTGGLRGGRADFDWSNVKDDKNREFFLGHSLAVPTGRWQNGRDITWFQKEKAPLADAAAGAADEEQRRQKRRAEMMEIKRKEEEEMYKKLGIKPGVLPSSGASVGPSLLGQPSGSGTSFLARGATGSNTAPLGSGSKWGSNGGGGGAEDEAPLSKEERRIAKKLAKRETKAQRREEKDKKREERRSRHERDQLQASRAARELSSTAIGKEVMIQTTDGRAFKGVLTCVDRHLNLLVSNAEELRWDEEEEEVFGEVNAVGDALPPPPLPLAATSPALASSSMQQETSIHQAAQTTVSTWARPGQKQLRSRWAGMVMISGPDLVHFKIRARPPPPPRPPSAAFSSRIGMGRSGERLVPGMPLRPPRPPEALDDDGFGNGHGRGYGGYVEAGDSQREGEVRLDGRAMRNAGWPMDEDAYS